MRRSGAVRHQVNPLTRRCQTLPDVHHNIIDSSRGREDEPRSAVSRSNAIRYQQNPLTYRQSERSYGGDDTKDVMSVDLSSFVPPPSVHHGPGPSTPVRRGAIRRGDNPLTSRRDALQENNPSKGSGSGSGSRHRGPPPTSLSDSSSFPVRRGAVRRSEIPLTSSDTFQGNGSDKYYQESSSHRSHGSSSRPPPTGGSSGVVFPVRRGATRSSENPLTSRRNTFQGNDYAPDTSSRDSQPQPDPYKNARTIEHPDFVNPTIICPQPRRNVIPNFGRDLGMAWFTDPRESDEETDPEDYSPRGSEEYAVLRPGPERKVQIVRPGLVTGEQEASSPGSQSRRDATANANEHQPPFKGHIYENPDWSQLMSPSSQRRMALDVMSEWDGVKGRGPFL